jgi:hypothetical protein
MTERMPGELTYERTIQSTGATSYGLGPKHRRRGQRRGTNRDGRRRSNPSI